MYDWADRTARPNSCLPWLGDGYTPPSSTRGPHANPARQDGNNRAHLLRSRVARLRLKFVCLLGLTVGLGCAASKRSAVETRGDEGGDEKSNHEGSDHNGVPIPENCLLPTQSIAVDYDDLPVGLCPKRDGSVLVAHNEAEYLAELACTRPDGVPVPSGIDWQVHELLFVRDSYQQEPGRIVRMLDTPQGRVAQFYVPRYCNGAAPVGGTMTWSLLLPQRGSGDVAIVGCEPEPCDWEINGQPPPS